MSKSFSTVGSKLTKASLVGANAVKLHVVQRAPTKPAVRKAALKVVKSGSFKIKSSSVGSGDVVVSGVGVDVGVGVGTAFSSGSSCLSLGCFLCFLLCLPCLTCLMAAVAEEESRR